jgi:hypothetical protein
VCIAFGAVVVPVVGHVVVFSVPGGGHALNVMSAYFHRLTSIVRGNKHLRYGVPFLTLIVGSTFVIKDFAQIRYDYRRVQSVALDEKFKYGLMRQPEEAEKEGLDPEKSNQKTIEEFHEEYVKNDLKADYDMIRGPRPWEIEPGTDIRPKDHKIVPKAIKTRESYLGAS